MPLVGLSPTINTKYSRHWQFSVDMEFSCFGSSLPSSLPIPTCPKPTQSTNLISNLPSIFLTILVTCHLFLLEVSATCCVFLVKPWALSPPDWNYVAPYLGLLAKLSLDNWGECVHQYHCVPDRVWWKQDAQKYSFEVIVFHLLPYFFGQIQKKSLSSISYVILDSSSRNGS